MKLTEPASVLSYLGIQRRNADEETNLANKPEPKAKKSFRPSVVAEQVDARLAFFCSFLLLLSWLV